MNRDEKNLQTRQKIIESALREFGEKSYTEASLNIICTSGNISKGIIYHYFKDKGELYLICVKECFDALTGCLKSMVKLTGGSVETTIESYFDTRFTFFEANPLYLRLFYNTATNPPSHLLQAISEIKAELDALNISVLTSLLKSAKLCAGITLNEVVEVFFEYQDFVNTRLQLQAIGTSALKAHEDRCRRSIKILLYGVISRDEITA